MCRYTGHGTRVDRCPVCGSLGYAKIKRYGDQIFAWCKAQRHPYYPLSYNEDFAARQLAAQKFFGSEAHLHA